MRFAPTAEQDELASAVRELLAGACPPQVVRQAWEPDAGPARGLWRHLAELGLLGAALPEAGGGMGLSEVDLVPLMVEVGRAAVPLPVAETVAVLVPLLHELGGHDEVLSALVSGEQVGTAELSGGRLLPWAAVSDVALVRDGQALQLLELHRVEPTPVVTVDRSRAAALLPAGAAGTVLTRDSQHLQRAFLRGALASAAQLVGLAQRQLDMTVDYTRERRQFGVPVGSQQAIKHALADVLLDLAFTLPVVQRASVSLAEGASDAPEHVAAAKAMASQLAEHCGRTCLQAHGAIGYTVEYDLHLFTKRGWALAAGWGSAAQHRDTVARALGLPSAVDLSAPIWETAS